MYVSGAQYKELGRLRNLAGGGEELGEAGWISLLLATETIRYNEIIPGGE